MVLILDPRSAPIPGGDPEPGETPVPGPGETPTPGPGETPNPTPADLNSIDWRTDLESIKLSLSIYQLFTGSGLEFDGYEFLISAARNERDLNDPYYGQFNLENRYINFANNLAVFGEGRSNFESKYGALSFEQTVRTAFEEIIGSDAIIADGGNPEDSIQFFLNAKSFYEGAANERVVPSGVSLDLGAKVVAISSILNEANKAGLGIYANAVKIVADEIHNTGTTKFSGQNVFNLSDPSLNTSGDVIAGSTTTREMVGFLSQDPASPTSITSKIDHVGDTDWFRLFIANGDQGTIKLSGTGDDALRDPFLQIYSTDGRELGSDDNSGPGVNSEISYQSDFTGFYIVGVSSSEAGGVGDYEISFL